MTIVILLTSSREDLARAETRMQWMSQRSDRFKALKDEYEKMVERELPGWLDQLSSHRKMKEEKQAEEERKKNEVDNISELFFAASLSFPFRQMYSRYRLDLEIQGKT